MSHILLVYGTGEGQTEKIASAIAGALEVKGHIATMLRGDKWNDQDLVSIYDGIIVGASIHVGKHQPYMLDWIERYRDHLASRPSAFFSVCLSAKDPTQPQFEQAAQYILDVITTTHWNPDVTASFGGAIPYTRLGVFKKYMLWWISRREGGDTDLSKDFEYTDWDAVQRFADDFGRLLPQRPTPIELPEESTKNIEHELEYLLTM